MPELNQVGFFILYPRKQSQWQREMRRN